MVASPDDGAAGWDRAAGWRRDHLARRSLAALGLCPRPAADPVPEAARLLAAAVRLTWRNAWGDLVHALGAMAVSGLLTVLALAHAGTEGPVLQQAYLTVLFGVFCILAAMVLVEDARVRLVGAYAVRRALAEDRWEDILRVIRSVERGASRPLDA